MSRALVRNWVAIFLSMGHFLRHLRFSPLCVYVCGDATGIWWVEIKDATRHLTEHRIAPCNKELSRPKHQ